MRWIITIGLLLIFQWYSFQAIKTISSAKWIWMVYILIVLLIIGNLLLHTLYFERTPQTEPRLMYAIGFFISLFVFQAVTTLVLLAEDVFRVPQAIYHFFSRIPGEVQFMPARRALISKIALGIAALPFSALLYGMYRGKYNYKVLAYDLEYEDLPEAFEGFKITQISDIHSGSFDNPDKVAYGIDLINQQQSDLVLFTGDLVNNKAAEIRPWIQYFSKIKAPHGVYSVLGNHDYGDYVAWSSEQEKANNLDDLKNRQRRMGFDLLLNEHRTIEREGSRIHIAGVENWGKPPFPQHGDLDKATKGIPKEDFTLLMSHDPSHFDLEVKGYDKHIALTLSGHTHGMQFGIEIPGLIKWSPVRLRYPKWAGLYEENNKRLYVNRGFGYLAFYGRVGIWPEITQFTLRSGKKA